MTDLTDLTDLTPFEDRNLSLALARVSEAAAIASKGIKK